MSNQDFILSFINLRFCFNSRLKYWKTLFWNLGYFLMQTEFLLHVPICLLDFLLLHIALKAVKHIFFKYVFYPD
jgi:hypothetical protein